MKNLRTRYLDYRNRHGVIISAMHAPAPEHVILGAVMLGTILGLCL